MYLFYTDETNLDPATADFFVYGGLAIPSDGAKALSQEIDAIRKSFGLPPESPLKFNPAPTGMAHEAFKQLKKAVLDATIASQCSFIANLTLHSIAKHPDEARRFAINSTAYHFDSFLSRRKDHGLVLIDRFTDAQIDDQLRDRFAVGVRGMPFSATMRLNNIIGFHYAAIGQGHFGSLIDIVLGSFRFSVNAFTKKDDGRRASADSILNILAPLFVREDDGRVSEISLHFSPMRIKSDSFRAKYEDLRNYLSSCGIEAVQKIQ